jgi:hypothetical protein
MLGPRLGRPADGNRAAGEPAEAAQAIIHDDGAGRGHVQRKGGWDADEMGAAGDQRGAARATFRPKHIGGLHRMGQGRELDCIIDKLDADQPASPRQAHLLDALPMVEGEMRGGAGGVGDGSMTRGSAPMVNTKFAPKAWAERKRLPRLTAFDPPSMPMAK